MICKNCNANIDEKSKFCIYCGSKVELVENSKQTVNIDMEVQNSNNVIGEPTINTDINMGTEENSAIANNNTVAQGNVNKDLEKTVVVPTEQLNEQIPVQNTPKKSNKVLIFVILGILLAIIAGILLFYSFNKTSNNSVKVLEKAVNNLVTKGENSGTINLDLKIEADASASVNLSAAVKYARVDDNYNIALKLNKSLLFDEINLYSTITDKDVILYAKSSLIDMLGTTSSPTDMWVHYMLNLDEVIDTEEENVELKSNIDLSSIFDDKHYKYIDKKDGLRQYQLIIDNDLLANIKKTAESSESLKDYLSEISEEDINLEQPIYLDFYINDSNDLVKISMDVSKMLEDESISKAVFEISFVDFANTSVQIPMEAKNSTTDIMSYMSTYMLKNELENNMTFNQEYVIQ